MSLVDRGKALRPSVFATVPKMLAPLVAGIVLAFLIQLFLAPMLTDFRTKATIDIGIAVIMAASLNIVNGLTGQFSIGHAGFMAVGAYTSAFITYYGSMKLWGSPDMHGGFLGGGDLLFIVACVAGGLVAALFGYIVGLPSLRLRGDYLAIVTLGFGEIIRVVLVVTKDQVRNVEAVQQASLPSLIPRLGGPEGFNNLPYYSTLFWMLTFVTITLLVAYRLKESSHGRAFLSIRENEIAAEAMGVNTTLYKVRAFAISAFFAGLAGGLFAHKVGAVNPRELGFQRSFEIVIMVVLGGMGSMSGAVLAAVALTALSESLREYSAYRMIIYAALLIITMIVRPKGLFGTREIWHYFGKGSKK